ncbi:hypothetical protein BN2497_8807 [Janthinobacterium sp. CG23_2]|nr:hypothetical protein BN2497_8807 [Janthinobacterium sp. CG23_2]CUU30801.1 hypothetical protein BN3177_8807 [Janthinobacterium sp. CG23_2]
MMGLIDGLRHNYLIMNCQHYAATTICNMAMAPFPSAYLKNKIDCCARCTDEARMGRRRAGVPRQAGA